MSTETKRNANWEQLEIWYADYLNGDLISTEALFKEIMRVLHGYFTIRMRAEPEVVADLLQATVLKIHFSRERFDQNQSLKTWVFTLASRTLIDHWRGASLEKERLEPVRESESEEMEKTISQIPSLLLDPAMKTELHGDLNQALKELKQLDRSIVYLYAVEGLSMDEISKTLDITAGAAKLRAHRAYKELRTRLMNLLFILIRGGL